MTYYDLLDKLGYGSEIKRYIDPLLGVGNFGVCGNAVSAYAAKRLTLPGTIPSNAPNRFADVSVVSFPGGNAAIFRKMWKHMLPEAISGDGSLAATAKAASTSTASIALAHRCAFASSPPRCTYATRAIRRARVPCG